MFKLSAFLETIRKQRQASTGSYIYTFGVPHDDLVLICCLYIRSVLEQNCNVWSASITEEENDDIERVQKVACRIIIKDDYSSYQEAITIINLNSLRSRQKQLSLNCLKNERTQDMFSQNPNFPEDTMEKYTVNFASTGRLMNSAIPSMQRVLNSDYILCKRK